MGKRALEQYETLGAKAFAQTNIAMMAIFVAAIILWITEAIPNYLTSFIVIITIVLLSQTRDFLNKKSRVWVRVSKETITALSVK